MSMINDALKRAKDAQGKSPGTAPGPQLRPAEPSQFANRSLSLMVPALLIFAVSIGVFFLWQAREKPTHNPEPVRAKTIVPENPQPKLAPPPVQAVQPGQRLKPVQTVASATPKPTLMAPKPSVAIASTPQKAAAPVVARRSTPLKLQAIFYSPGHASAIINEKTVRVGDALREYRIVSITQTSVKVISFTQTNVLTLAEQ